MAVTPDIIAVALGRDLSQLNVPQVGLWITDALSDVERYARLAGVSLDSLPAADVDRVVRNAVVAIARSPEGISRVSISVDDGEVAKTYSKAVLEVDVTPWLHLLGIRASRGAFSTRLKGGPELRQADAISRFPVIVSRDGVWRELGW